MLSHGNGNWHEIKRVLINDYGDGVSKRDSDTEEYYWYGKQTFIGADFNKSTDNIKIGIMSAEHYQNLNIEEEKKAILDDSKK